MAEGPGHRGAAEAPGRADTGAAEVGDTAEGPSHPGPAPAPALALPAGCRVPAPLPTSAGLLVPPPSSARDGPVQPRSVLEPPELSVMSRSAGDLLQGLNLNLG